MSIKIDRRQNNKLIAAYYNNDISGFCKLIKNGCNVNCINSFGISLIADVVFNFFNYNNNKKFFKALLDAGVHLKPIGTESGLLSIALENNEDDYYIKKLFEYNLNVNSCGIKSGISELPYGPIIFEIFDYRKYHLLDLILKQKPDLNALNYNDETILNYVIRCGYAHKVYLLEYVEKLVKNGADPNLPGEDGMQAIHHFATTANNDNLYNILINYDVNINCRNTKGETPLMLSVTWGNDFTAKFLIKNGVDIDLFNSNGQTALTIAAIFGNESMFNLLTRAGANRLIVDHNGNNILHHMLYNHKTLYLYVDIYENIIKQNPELLSMKNKKGETPLDTIKSINFDKKIIKNFKNFLNNFVPKDYEL